MRLVWWKSTQCFSCTLDGYCWFLVLSLCNTEKEKMLKLPVVSAEAGRKARS